MSTPDEPNMTDLSCLSAITSLVSPLYNCIDRPCAFSIASPWPTAMGYTDMRVQQHYISPLVTPPLPKEYRQSETDPAG